MLSDTFSVQDAWYPAFSLLSGLVVLPFGWINASVDGAVFHGQCARIIGFFLNVNWKL